MTDNLIERLLKASADWKAAYLNNASELFREAAEALAAKDARIAELEARLAFWARRKTIDERLHGPADREWLDASPERRVEMLGEQKAKHDSEVILARAALNSPDHAAAPPSVIVQP